MPRERAPESSHIAKDTYSAIESQKTFSGVFACVLHAGGAGITGDRGLFTGPIAPGATEKLRQAPFFGKRSVNLFGIARRDRRHRPGFHGPCAKSGIFHDMADQAEQSGPATGAG